MAVDYDPTDEIEFIDGNLFHWYCPMCGVWYANSMDDWGGYAAEKTDIEVRAHWEECIREWVWRAWA